MHVIQAKNVCAALPAGLAYLLSHGEREDSRAGPVLVAPGPVTTVYERPCERVLAAPVRDANPFFHLAEALWMLAGRDDAALLDRYVRDFGSRFAEPDGRVHGAYGRRWRHTLGYDQLDAVVELLRRDPGSRQAVLQMWDGRRDDLMLAGDSDFNVPKRIGEDDLRGAWRDRPCNTHAYLRIRGEVERHTSNLLGGDHRVFPAGPVLDLTVCCRSNDVVWGAYGANAVHFSVLQEYLAARLGVGVGRYYQVSNNYHVYLRELEHLRARANQMGRAGDLLSTLSDDRYRGNDHAPQRLVDDAGTFDLELGVLVNTLQVYPDLTEVHRAAIQSVGLYWRNKFLMETAWPMLMAHQSYRDGERDAAVGWMNDVSAPDWRAAGTEWLQRRFGKRAPEE